MLWDADRQRDLNFIVTKVFRYNDDYMVVFLETSSLSRTIDILKKYLHKGDYNSISRLKQLMRTGSSIGICICGFGRSMLSGCMRHNLLIISLTASRATISSLRTPSVIVFSLSDFVDVQTIGGKQCA